MSKVSFEIEIRGGELDGELVRFRPGDTLQGSVRITPVEDLKARHVYARLQWHTEGRGDRDQAVIEEQDLFQGMLRAGSPAYYSFHFRLPEHPWSYAGHYVNVIWEIETAIDLALTRDPQETKPFVLAPY
jgi:hypothetical protein